MAKKTKKRGQGEGGIYQRADGLWCGQVSLGYDEATGKRIRPTVYGDTRGEVVRKMDQLKREAEEGAKAQTETTLGELLDYWLSSTAHALTPLTKERYEIDIEHIRTHLGRLKLPQITGMHVTHLYQAMEAKGASRDQQHKCGQRLRQVLDYAHRLGYVKRNAAKDIPLPKPRRGEIQPLTHEEALLFLETARPHPLYPLFALALDTGARSGELFALEWADWNREASTLRIVKSLEELDGKHRVKETKTKASRRTVELGAIGQAALIDRWSRRRDDIPAIFHDRKGGYLRRSNVRRRALHPLLKKAGLGQIRFHDLRHTSATLLLAAGVDILTIADRLGHSSPRQLLDTYGHTLPSMRARAAKVIGELLGGSKAGSTGGASSS